MDTIRFLLSKIVKLTLGLLFLSLVLWLVGTFYPDLHPSKVFSWKLFSADWLPAPKNYGSLLGERSTDGTNGKVYVPGPAYNGYTSGPSGADVSWVYYTATGTQIIRGGSAATISSQTFTSAGQATQNTNGFSDRSSYIRNISVYEGGTITYGMTIYGEARDTMFKNGLFTIVIVDQAGKVITTAQAINTGTWATPGWARFQTTIPSRLPSKVRCGMLFLSANQPIKVGMTVQCN